MPCDGMLLWAQTRPGPTLTTSEFVNGLLFYGAALLGVLIVLILFISRIRGWLREDDGLTSSPEQMLQQMLEMERRGEISEHEFRSIKGRLGSEPSRASDSDPQTGHSTAPEE